MIAAGWFLQMDLWIDLHNTLLILALPESVPIGQCHDVSFQYFNYVGMLQNVSYVILHNVFYDVILDTVAHDVMLHNYACNTMLHHVSCAVILHCIS